MGRKKLTKEVKKRNITFKLKPEVIEKIHEIAEAKKIKVVHVVEECLNSLYNG